VNCAIAGLRQIALSGGTTDIYHVHHGSISPNCGKHLKIAMQLYRAVTAATSLGNSTLVSWNEWFSAGVNHFRIQFYSGWGRSGRRGEPANMRLFARRRAHPARIYRPSRFPNRYKRSCYHPTLIALIELIRPYNYTLSVSAVSPNDVGDSTAMGEISAAALAAQVLTLPFGAISQDDLRTAALTGLILTMFSDRTG